MSEAEKLLREENKEKKRLGYSARSKRGGGGHKTSCTLPHERLTKKQLKQLNGEVIQLNLNSKISWEEFKKLPRHMQKEYIEHMRDEYGARMIDIANMMDVNYNTMLTYVKRAEITVEFPKGIRLSPKWIRFIDKADEEQATQEEPMQQEAPITQEEAKPKLDWGIEEGMITIKGTGANLINCILRVLGSETDEYEAQFRFSKINS